MNLEAALRDQVEKATGKPGAHKPVKQLKGDASNRSYYRVGDRPDSHADRDARLVVAGPFLQPAAALRAFGGVAAL